MDRRRLLAIILLILSLLIIISVPIWLFTPVGDLFSGPDLNAPPLTPLTFTPDPPQKNQAEFIPQGKPAPLLATEAILMDSDTGVILYQKDGEGELPMASTTKIMTALIAIQAGNLDQMIPIGQDAISMQKIGSKADLVAGTQLSLRDLLYGLMLPSGDDAAVAIADGVAGSQEAFVHIMNVEAQKLNLFQTHFFDATGLDTDLNLNPIPANMHYTTPYDFVRLARYAMHVPLFAQIVSQPTYNLAATATHGKFHWVNTNTLLTTYKGLLGIKTGWTGAAGGCLVFAARRNGHTLIGVVLHSSGVNTTQVQDEQTRSADAEKLLNWGFGLPTAIA